MRTIIYCRISSNNQTKGVSLQTQLSACENALKENNMNDYTIIQEVGSAYKKIPVQLATMYNKKNTTVVAMSIDRFSRNVENGTKMIINMLLNGCRFIFLREKLNLSSVEGENWHIFQNGLRQAEAESRAIGERVKASVMFLRRNGYQVGGKVPYGFKAVPSRTNPRLKRLHQDDHEQNVISFVRSCRTVGTTVDAINQALFKITHYREPIIIERDDEEMKVLENAMCYDEIAGLLNEYDIKNRGHSWTTSSVTRINNRELRSHMDVDMDIDEIMINTKTFRF